MGIGFRETINWYDDNAEQYAANIERLVREDLLNDFAQRLPEGALVLEAGCAAGRDTIEFANRGLQVTAVDISTGLLAVARNKYPTLNFLAADFREKVVSSNSMDGVFSHASLLHFEHLEDVEKALAQFYDALKPGGVLCVVVKQQLGEEKSAVVSDTLSNHDRFFQWFTKDELEKLVTDSGFSNCEVTENNVDPANRADVKWLRLFASK